MAAHADPERDPLFRGLVLLMALAITVTLALNVVFRQGSAATASTGSGSTPTTQPTDDMSGMSGGSGTMSAAQMAKMHEASMKAFPAKTAGTGGQVLEPTVEHGVKVFHLMAMMTQWEVAPGQTVMAFAYNEQVPGPEIRVHRGDHIKVVLLNHLPQPTTIHWHGVTVPNKDDGVPYVTQDPIMPDQTYTYEFTVKDQPGTYLYHSHFNSTEQVGNGLYGAFVVEPEGTPAWDSAYTEILNDGTLGYTIQGKGWPATAPMVASKGEDVLIRLANVGQMLHPIHLHGYHFTVIAQDGAPLANPYSADTVVVAPGETYDLLVRTDLPGVWAMHCHILSHVEGPQGMFGMATALVVS